MKTKKKNKKNIHKTKKQKKAIKNRYEAKKYIEILNIAYKQLTSSWHDIFDKDDYLLLPYIKQGIKKGWKILKDKNIIKEIKCNSLCMTMAILNSTLGDKKSLNQLNPVQQIYLFFISYLIDDSKLPSKQVSLKHAIRKIDLRIQGEINKLEKYEKKKDNRNIKKCNKYIEKQESLKKQLLETNGLNKEGITSAFKLDVCNTIDCEYLHEYKMEKGKKWNESYSKFCLSITEIFKGIVWLNMYMLFNKTTKIERLSPYMKKIETNIDIRKSFNAVDILLIPNSIIYKSELFYENNTLDQARKKIVNDPFYYPLNKKYWVYRNLNLGNKTIEKIKVCNLQNKHYVVAMMSLPFECDWKSPNELKEKQMYKNFYNFIQGIAPLPKLKEITKNIRKIGDEDRYDLKEYIENTITLHWIYIHKDQLDDFISEYV